VAAPQVAVAAPVAETAPVRVAVLSEYVAPDAGTSGAYLGLVTMALPTIALSVLENLQRPMESLVDDWLMGGARDESAGTSRDVVRLAFDAVAVALRAAAALRAQAMVRHESATEQLRVVCRELLAVHESNHARSAIPAILSPDMIRVLQSTFEMGGTTVTTAEDRGEERSTSLEVREVVALPILPDAMISDALNVLAATAAPALSEPGPAGVRTDPAEEDFLLDEDVAMLLDDVSPDRPDGDGGEEESS
jgi:hypothetical protein